MSQMGGQIAAFGALVFGMLWTCFVYIAVVGFKCKDPASAALGWCDTLKSDPETAIIVGIIFAVLFFIAWIVCVGILFLGDNDNKSMWITFTFGTCSFILCIVGIPVLILTLYYFSYVPDIKQEFCEAQCTITAFTKQEIASTCDGVIRNDVYWGKVCEKRVASDTGTWSESKCRRILQVSINKPSATPACISAFSGENVTITPEGSPFGSKTMTDIAAVAHASQWVPCFGGGSNPQRVSAWNLQREYKKDGTYSCLFSSF